MRYQKANEILPEELVELLQTYLDGEYEYVPRKQENKKSWGETSRVKEEFRVRDAEMYENYRQGVGVKTLAEQYYLSEKSIQRIVLQEKKLEQKER